MKLFAIFLIAILLLQVFAEGLAVDDSSQSVTQMDEGANEENGEAVQRKFKPRKINCSYACSRRCRKASRKNVCSRACKACCAKCNCVPPGTYGNKEVCPCYASLRTKGNKLKCP